MHMLDILLWIRRHLKKEQNVSECLRHEKWLLPFGTTHLPRAHGIRLRPQSKCPTSRSLPNNASISSRVSTGTGSGVVLGANVPLGLENLFSRDQSNGLLVKSSMEERESSS